MRVVNSLDSTAKKVDPPYSSNRSLIYPFWAKGYPSRTTHPRSLAALLGTLGHMIFCLPGSPFLALFLHVSPCSWKPLTWRPFWSCHYTPWNHGSGKPPPVVFQGAMPSSSMLVSQMMCGFSKTCRVSESMMCRGHMCEDCLTGQEHKSLTCSKFEG